MTSGQTHAAARAETSVLALSFLWTAIGLSITFVVATSVVAVAGESAVAAGESLLAGVVTGSIAIVLVLAWRLDGMPAWVAELLFVSLTALQGLALSLVLWIVPVEVVVAALGAAVVAFAGAAAVGLVVRRDLSTMGLVLTLALVGLVAATLVDRLWVASLLPYPAVALFTLLVVYDVWWLGRIGRCVTTAEDARRLAVWGAVGLYLDLLNLIVWLVQIIVQAALLDD